MIIEIKLPVLGEGVDSGTVAGVLVAIGDTVKPDDPIVELETDKAVIEVPSGEGGVVKSLTIEVGETVTVGQVIATINLGESQAKETSPAMVVATDSSLDSMPNRPEIPPPPSSNFPSTAPTGPVTVSAANTPAGDNKFNLPDLPIPATPNTRRFARDLGVDITTVQADGNDGRIRSGDVVRTARSMLESANGDGGEVSSLSLPDFSRWGEVERKPMVGVRRATAVQLSTAWNTIPHVTQHDEADITELEKLRKRCAPRVQEAGGKLTMTAIAIRVVAAALQTFPQFSSSVDMAKREIILKRYTHIGVAVDTDRGLLVPVLRDVGLKNLTELSIELGDLAAKARAGKLTLEEMQGGCFTITNLGGIGGTTFTPIVNHPEVAILGMSRARVTAVYREGGFQPRSMLPMSLSYDHRAIDGADAIRFLRWIIEALESPSLLAL